MLCYRKSERVDERETLMNVERGVARRDFAPNHRTHHPMGHFAGHARWVLYTNESTCAVVDFTYQFVECVHPSRQAPKEREECISNRLSGGPSREKVWYIGGSSGGAGTLSPNSRYYPVLHPLYVNDPL
jgi:hypothetical protein